MLLKILAIILFTFILLMLIAVSFIIRINLIEDSPCELIRNGYFCKYEDLEGNLIAGHDCLNCEHYKPVKKEL